MLAENHYRLGILFNLLLQFTFVKYYSKYKNKAEIYNLFHRLR